MRIIAGKWRSRLLHRPDESVTRPIPDRVKESIFNRLGVHWETPGRLPPIRVADVFAGSGSLGLEALSRGAAACTFFEKDRTAIGVLKRNLEELKVDAASADVRIGDAWRLAALPDGREPTDLMFLDPPYTDSADAGGEGVVGQFFFSLARNGMIPNVLVLHHPADTSFEKAVDLPAIWSRIEERAVGSNRVTYLLK